jgi:hypothetical protein
VTSEQEDLWYMASPKKNPLRDIRAKIEAINAAHFSKFTLPSISISFSGDIQEILNFPPKRLLLIGVATSGGNPQTRIPHDF